MVTSYMGLKQGQIVRGDILQIIPGGGWKAVYGFESEGELYLRREPLVCFALRKFIDPFFMQPGEDGQLLEGYTGGESIEPAEAPNLLGYEGPGEEDDEEWTELLESWWKDTQKIKSGEYPIKV